MKKVFCRWINKLGQLELIMFSGSKERKQTCLNTKTAYLLCIYFILKY